MPKGLIVRALSSFYYVTSENKVYECKARGVFKKQKVSPLVGDYVTFDLVDSDKGYIMEVDKRKNELVRPPISNVDQAILVFSVNEPGFNSTLMDKFIIHIEKADIKPIICITKMDLLSDLDERIKAQMKKYSSIGYQVITTSKNGEGIEDLQKTLKNKISVFSGQSGVGKSTLLNTLLPQLNLETAQISKKLGRGKHTTREVQLIVLPEGGLVADTPGFSQLDFEGIASGELQEYFIEFAKYNQQCKYRSCMHKKEPGCAVKEAVSKDEIDDERYQHYLNFLTEIEEMEERKWR